MVKLCKAKLYFSPLINLIEMIIQLINNKNKFTILEIYGTIQNIEMIVFQFDGRKG